MKYEIGKIARTTIYEIDEIGETYEETSAMRPDVCYGDSRIQRSAGRSEYVNRGIAKITFQDGIFSGLHFPFKGTYKREEWDKLKEFHRLLEDAEAREQKDHVDAGWRPTVMVSGGFDPLHVGHLRMFKQASELGRLIVVLNSDDWLMRKKNYIFMPWTERAELIKGYSFVSDVVSVDDSDGSVCEALKRIKPNIFANGGDRFADNIPEAQVCKDLGIKTHFGIGGTKVQSSSELVRKSMC